MKCHYLNLNPYITPMFPEVPEFYLDLRRTDWVPMPELEPKVDVKWGYAKMAVLPLEAFKEGDPPPEDPGYYYPPGVVER